MPAHAGSVSTTRALLLAGVFVAPMYYGLQAAAAPFFPDFSLLATTASELGSDLSPVAAAFNVGVIAQGVLTLLAAVGVGLALRALGHRAVLAAAAAALFALNGVQTLWAGAFPMPDPRHGGHPLFIVGMLLLPPACLWITWRHARSRWLRALTVGAVLLLAIMVPIMSGAVAVDTHGFRGALQRVFTLSVFPPILIACVVLRARLGAATGRARIVGATLGALLVASTSAAPSTAWADVAEPKRPPPAFAAPWPQSIPLVMLAQTPAQSDHDVLREVAAAIDALTHALVAEVCGVFERDDGTARLMILVMTQGSPAFCRHRRARRA